MALHRIPFTVLVDKPGDPILRHAISVALTGARPSQPDREADWFIDGSVYYGLPFTQIYLTLAAMNEHTVRTGYRGDFPASQATAEIAQMAADAFWDKITTSASSKMGD